jgi:hypothetical protein
MTQLHWLWPTLIVETEIPTDDRKSFNARLTKTILAASNSRTPFWDMETPELLAIKEECRRSVGQYLEEIGMTHKFSPGEETGWVNVYQPGQYIQPHYHGALELISTYYVTDEDEIDRQPLITPIDPEKHTMSKMHGYTSFHDPRNAFELRPNPSVEFRPQAGHILTAPGHLLHWSLPTNKSRIVITCRNKLEEQ